MLKRYKVNNRANGDVCEPVCRAVQNDKNFGSLCKVQDDMTWLFLSFIFFRMSCLCNFSFSIFNSRLTKTLSVLLKWISQYLLVRVEYYRWLLWL